MRKILIGIPTIQDFEPFWLSLSDFLVNAKEFYEINTCIISNKRLGEAQNTIVDRFLKSDYEYLLFLDDDHWGHTVKMLDCLIKANTFVTTMKTFSRHYPYACTLIKQSENGLIPIEHSEGYLEVDLTGFPMTLIRRDTFNHLDKPYFREESFNGRDWHTDVNFFNRLNDKAIKPIGCYQHCLNHVGITEENVNRLRLAKSREAQFERSL